MNNELELKGKYFDIDQQQQRLQQQYNELQQAKVQIIQELNKIYEQRAKDQPADSESENKEQK